ncbi:MAG TPA: YdcF family protein [Candidatus Saccharimonadales bacterium]
MIEFDTTHQGSSAETELVPSEDAAIRELVTQDFNGLPPEVIFPLSGSIIQRRDGRWDTLSGSDVSEHGITTVGKVRTIAGAKIAHLFPDLPVVANSYNRFDPDEPTMASVHRDELIRKGVNPERIILEEESFSTITQYVEMIKMAVERGWTRVSVIINGYYEPRATALYEHLDSIVENAEFQQTLQQFKRMNGEVSFVVGDDIMKLMNKHYEAYFDELERTPAYQKTVTMEKKGLEDLLAGKYRVVLEPERPRY